MHPFKECKLAKLYGHLFCYSKVGGLNFLLIEASKLVHISGIWLVTWVFQEISRFDSTEMHLIEVFTKLHWVKITMHSLLKDFFQFQRMIPIFTLSSLGKLSDILLVSVCLLTSTCYLYFLLDFQLTWDLCNILHGYLLSNDPQYEDFLLCLQYSIYFFEHFFWKMFWQLYH